MATSGRATEKLAYSWGRRGVGVRQDKGWFSGALKSRFGANNMTDKIEYKNEKEPVTYTHTHTHTHTTKPLGLEI